MALSFTSVLLVVLLSLQCSITFSKLGFAENVTVCNYTVEEGKPAQFECDASATSPFYYYKYIAKNINPPINLMHESEGVPWTVFAVNQSNSPSNLRTIPSFLAKSENHLTITNITVEYNNVLVCCQGHQRSGRSLGNDQNVTSLSVKLCYRVNVQFSPQILQSSVNPGQWITPLHPSYGQYVVISCPLEGNPLPSYQWHYALNDEDRGMEIEPNSNLNITLLNNNRTLYFEEFKEEHNGYYTCNAKNFLGNNTYHSPLIQVEKCAAFHPAKPSVTINASHDLVVYVGDDLNIECVVASIPKEGRRRIRWYKSKDEIYHSGPADRVYYQLSDFDKIQCRQIITLNIKNLTFEDSVPEKQPDYKQLIIKISIPVSVVIILLAISVTIGIFYYLRVCQVKLQKALEEYRRRPLPKRGEYQYEFFFAMTEDDEDKLEVDKLYVTLKQSFSIYYQLDQYLPGRTKVEMVTEGIKNSRFIIIILSKTYLQQKDEITQLELMYTMNRVDNEFTKCAFIVTLEDTLFIPYKLRHITKFPKEGADIKLKELATTVSLEVDSFLPSEDVDDESIDDAMELEPLYTYKFI